MNEKQMIRAAALLKQEFGDRWMTVAQMIGTQDLRKRVGKELTSFMAFPDRGDGGNNQWRGNCSPEVVAALIRYVIESKRYYGKDTSSFTLLDPMSGSGTSKHAADRFGIQSILYDLNPSPATGRGNWNALKDEVDESADLIFLHPPYANIIQYSGHMWGKPHPDDLSRCENYNDFIEKLNHVIKKMYMALRKDGRLAILVGDIRKNGQFHSIQNDMMKVGIFESYIVKSQFNCVSDNRTYKKPFIPIVTESLLIFHKQDVFMIPFSVNRTGTLDLSNQDVKELTWHHLVRMTLESIGGQAKLSDLYCMLEKHPKAKQNTHFRERIRATMYEHPQQYIACGNGHYKLSYAVA